MNYLELYIIFLLNNYQNVVILVFCITGIIINWMNYKIAKYFDYLLLSLKKIINKFREIK